MLPVPNDLRQQLQQLGQEHVLAFWDRLTDAERRDLLDQLRRLNLYQLRGLYENRDSSFAVPSTDEIQPVPVIPLDADTATACRLGEESLRKGAVAVLLVAGGQGSRLGFDQPKGMFPVGPVTNKTLFQIHAEKVMALRRRYGQPLPFLMMTSPATDAETRAFFASQQYFGLPSDEVAFFCQGTMPALDRTTGKLLLEAPDRLFLSPNGHGGTLTALADSGLLDRLCGQGIRQIFYFQVDNPLVKIADPVFLGYHLQNRAEVSAKIVPKESPSDKLGNLVLVNDRCTMIEYSDLPESLAKQTDENGRLRIWAGSPAIHVFEVDFLKRVVGGEATIPFHVAQKKVPYLDASGNVVQPTEANALKFELFIFDVLPLAERVAVVETSRREEFYPLKNATGPDSPETVRQAQSDLFANWLQQAGMTIPRNADGSAAVALEVSPLFALDVEEFAAKVDRSRRIDGSTYFG
jgi:UDP-N-acetylglucosamine/UDP-N-acetylgalactosamine diphosphorylase